MLHPTHPHTLADAATEYAGPLRELWQALPMALRDDAWRGPDVFGQVAGDPVRTVSHHRMLRSYARHDYSGVPEALALRGDEHVLEIGGGVGVLAELLLATYPQLEVSLVERPEVVAQVPQRDRLTRVAHDLFTPLPVRGDAAVLARVLHDWDTHRAVEILRHVRAALPPKGRVYVIELLVSADGAFGGLCDIHLLMATGGRERTTADYAELLGQAGFDLVKVRALGTVPSVLVAEAR